MSKYMKPGHRRPKHLGKPKEDKIIRISRPPRFPRPLAGGGHELARLLHKTQESKGCSHPRRGRGAEVHPCKGGQEPNLTTESCNSHPASSTSPPRSCQIGLGNKCEEAQHALVGGAGRGVCTEQGGIRALRCRCSRCDHIASQGSPARLSMVTLLVSLSEHPALVSYFLFVTLFSF